MSLRLRDIARSSHPCGPRKGGQWPSALQLLDEVVAKTLEVVTEGAESGAEGCPRPAAENGNVESLYDLKYMPPVGPLGNSGKMT